MEYSRSGLDLLLWPREWHKRFNPSIMLLIPFGIFVGIYDVLNAQHSIVNDYLMTANSGIVLKILLALIIAAIIGLIDVACFAWPIADLCRYIGKRTEKYVARGFHVILMKSYALSHLVFVPLIPLTMPPGLQSRWLNQESMLYSLIVSAMLIWQLAILLRTVGVKTKLEYTGKLIVGAAIYIWTTFEGTAIGYLLYLAHSLFGKLAAIT
ncbi:MAG: hypothetical protein GX115_14830 [Ruminiclostridium sp.]|nr:hypothetical protein [Ruminiclostridium sp.]